MNRARDLVDLLRPRQWVKNVFVFAGVLFAHAWTDMALLARVAAAAAAFCAMASAIYVVNDLADREADRCHPVKCRRPLAAGRVSVGVALILAAVLAVVAAGVAFWASPTVLLLVLVYACMNLAYSAGLKQVVILDVFVIAAGFMLRLLAGTLGVGIPPSHWLLLTGLFLTLFLGFAKRRAEWLAAGRSAPESRRVLQSYGPELLDHMLSVTAAGVVMSYSLFTLSPETVARHRTEHLIFTVPLVLYAVFRYMYLLHHEARGEDPATELMLDPHLVFTFLAWVALTVWLIA